MALERTVERQDTGIDLNESSFQTELPEYEVLTSEAAKKRIVERHVHFEDEDSNVPFRKKRSISDNSRSIKKLLFLESIVQFSC
eukprot:UN01650